MINKAQHPDHYCTGEIECIDSIRASLSREGFLGYCKGNLQKYIWRYEKKHDDPLEDLLKAKDYLEWMIEEFSVK
jgi:hypothetical protein